MSPDPFSDAAGKMSKKCPAAQKKCQKNGKKQDCTVDAKFVDGESNYYCGRHKKRANKVKAIKFKKASKMPLDELATNLHQAFDKMPQLLQVDRVVIENQPCLQNPKMKSVQMLIYSYFLFYGKCSSASLISEKHSWKVGFAVLFPFLRLP